jgi:hypothetical protein
LYKETYGTAFPAAFMPYMEGDKIFRRENHENKTAAEDRDHPKMPAHVLAPSETVERHFLHVP